MQQFISAENIKARVRQLGREISADCPTEEIVVLSVLKGSFIFTADLVRELTIPCRIAFVAASSYGHDRSSSGTVSLGTLPDLSGHHVLIVEDIVDTGLTLSHIRKAVSGHAPASLKTCTLLDKPSARRVDVPVEYIGFTVPDRYVFGYGMDAGDRYRELPYIAVDP